MDIYLYMYTPRSVVEGSHRLQSRKEPVLTNHSVEYEGFAPPEFQGVT